MDEVMDELKFRKVLNGWVCNGLSLAVAEHPLFKWVPGMRQVMRNAPDMRHVAVPDLNDTCTVALLAEQARRMGEGQQMRADGGWERVRANYRLDARRSHYDAEGVMVKHVAPIANGWKVKGLDTDYLEHDAVAKEVWATEGEAWAAGWLLAAYDAVECEGGEYNGVKRDGLARCREIFGIEAHEGERPVPLFVRV